MRTAGTMRARVVRCACRGRVCELKESIPDWRIALELRENHVRVARLWSELLPQKSVLDLTALEMQIVHVTCRFWSAPGAWLANEQPASPCGLETSRVVSAHRYDSTQVTREPRYDSSRCRTAARQGVNRVN